MGKKALFAVGDSVSIHYGFYLKQMINDQFIYARKDGALMCDSRAVLNYLMQENSKGVRYDISLVNCGLHDIRIDRHSGDIQVTGEEYEENLKKIVDTLLQMAKKVIWVNITPVIDSLHNARTKGYLRFSKDVIYYNEISERVMTEQEIPIIDIFSFTKNLGEGIYIDHVHFKEEVRALQAAFISGYLLNCKT
ncbi:hypothetical protein CEB3_c19850 [Peptococcaceae bacterium CEB3]|nr:hypothetical protein CEB3_c19850 [Peptococcaceae bacterium CEB3]